MLGHAVLPVSSQTPFSGNCCVPCISHCPITRTKYLTPTTKRRRGLPGSLFPGVQSMVGWLMTEEPGRGQPLIPPRPGSSKSREEPGTSAYLSRSHLGDHLQPALASAQHIHLQAHQWIHLMMSVLAPPPTMIQSPSRSFASACVRLWGDVLDLSRNSP